MPTIPAHLWMIHGKFYDFNSFVEKHPGGQSYILAGRGRECTELFESVHVFCDSDVSKMLESYRIKQEDVQKLYGSDSELIVTEQEDFFNWKDEKGFYPTLKQRVLAEMKGKSAKADTIYWIKVPIMTLLAVYCLINFFKGSYAHAFIYGCLVEMLGFCVMHDASHGGVSKLSWINESLSVFWNSWAQWSHWIWMQHHVWAHHSYTGIYLKDPDIVHWVIFLRKSKESPHFPFHKYQSKYWWSIVSFWPNQHLGQIIVYQLSLWLNHRLFGMPLFAMPTFIASIETWLRVTSLLIHFVLPYVLLPASVALTCQFLVVTAMGLNYWLAVFPNHDTLPSHEALQAKPAEGMDWGELQVRSSSNHSNSDSIGDTLITNIWGGMNYQIEHHLFPSLSHRHYSTIAPIVKKTAAEFNIPYPLHKTWFDALLSYIGFLKLMEKK